MKRVVSIDIARAIGIVLVVIGHYLPDGAPLWYLGMREWIYSFHMPLFVFISGYVYMLTYRKESYKDFLLRKSKRLLIPYFIVSVIIISIKILSQKAMGMDIKNPVDATSFIRMFAYPEAAIHLWFIFAIWWIFVTVPLFSWRGGHVVLLVIAAALHYLPQIYPVISFPEIFCIRKAAEYLLYFMCGAVLFDLGLNLEKPNRIAAVTAFAVFVLNSVFGFAPCIAEYIGIAGIIGLASLIQYLPRCLKPILLISDSSYTIYLVHSIFIGFVVTALKMFPALLDTDSRLFALGALTVVSASVILSVITHRIVNRVRSL